MRACPVCKSYYPDGAMNCAQDGATLVEVPAPERTASIQIDSDVHEEEEPGSFSGSYAPPAAGATDETRAATPGASRGYGSSPSEVPILVSDPLFASQGSWQTPHPKKRRRGSSAQDMAEARLGEVLGSYRLVEVLGLGGMGTVYRAEHVKLGREVALKLLHQDYAQRRDAVSRFFQEARAVNKIRHRNIVDITDLVELDDGTTFLVMELLRGVPLTKLMRGAGGLDTPRALTILVQICDGLSAAHSVGIVHRDLKPDNIFIVVTPDGADEVKLVDFGVAKLVGADHTKVSANTVAGAVIGTPAFMSPEQAGGLKVDARSDVYSLGAIMFEIFSGRPVFRGKSFSDYVRKHLNDQPPLMQVDAHGTPIDPRIEEVVQTCLKKSPDQRYDSAKALRGDLLTVLAAIGGTDPRTAEELVLPSAPEEEGPTLPEGRGARRSGPGPFESGPMPVSSQGSYPYPVPGHAPDASPAGGFAPDAPTPGSGPMPPPGATPASGPLRTLSPGPWQGEAGGSTPDPGMAFPPPVVSDGSGAMHAAAGPPGSGASPGLDTALTAGDLPRDPTQQRGPFRWSFLIGGALALAAGIGIGVVLLGSDGEGGEQVAARGEKPAAVDTGGAASGSPDEEGSGDGAGPEEGGDTAAPLPIVKPMEGIEERPDPQRLVTVRFVSDPEADVFPSGSTEAACNTPCDLTIDPADGGSPRRRDFLLRRAGYRDEVVTVNLQDPEDVIEVALERREDRDDSSRRDQARRADREDRRGSSRRDRKRPGPDREADERERKGEERDPPGGQNGEGEGTPPDDESEEGDEGRPYDPEDTMNPFGPR